MERITKRDVSQVFGRFTILAEEAGLGARNEWELQHGSPTNGRAWRLFKHCSNGGVSTALNIGDRGYIGWTTRDAYFTLNGLVCGLEALV